MHEIAKELQTALGAQGCPFQVIDGPEASTTTTGGRERIVIEHADGDRYGAVRGTHVNPKHKFTRSVSAKATIYAQSPATGALPYEHRRRAEHALDLVLVALDGVAVERHNQLTVTGGKFIEPADFANSQVQPGAVYELTFTIDRAVMVRTWAGAAQPEVVVGTDVEITPATLDIGE